MTAQAEFDLVIRGGRVVDGTRMPSFIGDVAIKDGKIAEIGCIAGSGTQEIDARGLVVAGMPAGSPGMEVPGGHVDPYTVELVERDGTTKPFSVHAGTLGRQ